MSEQKPPSFAMFQGQKIKSKICDTEREAMADALSRPQNLTIWGKLKYGYAIREVSSIDMDVIYKKGKDSGEG